ECVLASALEYRDLLEVGTRAASSPWHACDQREKLAASMSTTYADMLPFDDLEKLFMLHSRFYRAFSGAHAVALGAMSLMRSLGGGNDAEFRRGLFDLDAALHTLAG